MIHYRALEFVDPVPFSHTNLRNCVQAKIEENVPANNCHPKVVEVHLLKHLIVDELLTLKASICLFCHSFVKAKIPYSTA